MTNERFKMESDGNLDGMWRRYVDVSGRYKDEIVSAVRGNAQSELVKDDVILRLREWRDLRREFMAACGECDDGYISQQEAGFLRETEFVFKNIVDLFGVTDEEIDAVKLPFATSTGRKTAAPQFTPRIDL